MDVLSYVTVPALSNIVLVVQTTSTCCSLGLLYCTLPSGHKNKVK